MLLSCRGSRGRIKILSHLHFTISSRERDRRYECGLPPFVGATRFSSSFLIDDNKRIVSPLSGQRTRTRRVLTNSSNLSIFRSLRVNGLIGTLIYAACLRRMRTPYIKMCRRVRLRCAAIFAHACRKRGRRARNIDFVYLDR